MKHLVSFRIAALLFAFVVLLYGIQVLLRTVDYRDPAAYLLSAVRVMRPLAASELENKHYFEGAKNWYTTCRNLGYLFVEKKDPANAELWFLRALDHTAAYFDPRYAAECHLSLGELYLKQDRIPEAQSQLTAAISGASRPQQVYNLLGVCSAMRDDPHAAEVFFLKALEIDPDFGSARANLARLRR
jgi:Tfp pilus assembly protein PilF